MVTEVDGVVHLFIVEFNGSFDSIILKVSEVAYGYLVGYLGGDIGRSRKPYVERGTSSGITRHLKVLPGPCITGFDRASLAQKIICSKTWLQPGVRIEKLTFLVSGRVNCLVFIIVVIYGCRAHTIKK